MNTSSVFIGNLCCDDVNGNKIFIKKMLILKLTKDLYISLRGIYGGTTIEKYTCYGIYNNSVLNYFPCIDEDSLIPINNIITDLDEDMPLKSIKKKVYSKVGYDLKGVKNGKESI